MSLALHPEKTLTGKSLILKKFRFYAKWEQENTLTTFLLARYIDQMTVSALYVVWTCRYDNSVSAIWRWDVIGRVLLLVILEHPRNLSTLAPATKIKDDPLLAFVQRQNSFTRLGDTIGIRYHMTFVDSSSSYVLNVNLPFSSKWAFSNAYFPITSLLLRGLYWNQYVYTFVCKLHIKFLSKRAQRLVVE